MCVTFVRKATVVIIATLMVRRSSALANGLARTPPLGWRSWNAYGGSVTQEKMEAVMEAFVDDTKGFSLKSLGYEFIGLDDGWQLCGAGVNGSFHTARGDPIVDKSKFRNMTGMVAKAKMDGWMDGWMVWWMDGWMDKQLLAARAPLCPYIHLSI